MLEVRSRGLQQFRPQPASLGTGEPHQAGGSNRMMDQLSARVLEPIDGYGCFGVESSAASILPAQLDPHIRQCPPLGLGVG